MTTGVGVPSVEIAIRQWHPARLNEIMGGHWSRGNRLKKRDREMVWAYSRDEAKATGKRCVEISITLKPRQRGADPDAYFKSVLDALKHAGMIVDDNRQGVELAPVIYERGTDERWGTRIRLWDVS